MCPIEKYEQQGQGEGEVSKAPGMPNVYKPSPPSTKPSVQASDSERLLTCRDPQRLTRLTLILALMSSKSR